MLCWSVAVVWVQVLTLAVVACLALPFALLAWLLFDSFAVRSVGEWYTWWLVLTLFCRALPLVTGDE